MDTLVVHLSVGEDPTEPMWEPEHDGSAMHDCGDGDEEPATPAI
jgi:hypothetical protein